MKEKAQLGARQRDVRGTVPLSLTVHLSGCLLRVGFLPLQLLRLLLSPRVVGDGKSSGYKTHWHTYRSFPFLRFEYHKTWRAALKAAQTAMQSRTKPVASAV